MTAQRGAREELAEALHDIALACDPPLGWHDQDQILTRFLPAVERMAAQRAADELRAAGAELHVVRFNADDDPEARWPVGSDQVLPDSFYRGVVLATLALNIRADRLDSQAAPSCQASYTEGSSTWMCLRGTGHDGQHEDSAGHRW